MLAKGLKIYYFEVNINVRVLDHLRSRYLAKSSITISPLSFSRLQSVMITLLSFLLRSSPAALPFYSRAAMRSSTPILGVCLSLSSASVPEPEMMRNASTTSSSEYSFLGRLAMSEHNAF